MSLGKDAASRRRNLRSHDPARRARAYARHHLTPALAAPWPVRERCPTLAFYPGGFGPPHAGHWRVAKTLLDRATVVVIVVSDPVPHHAAAAARRRYARHGVLPSESLQLWRAYLGTLPTEERGRAVVVTSARVERPVLLACAQLPSRWAVVVAVGEDHVREPRKAQWLWSLEDAMRRVRRRSLHSPAQHCGVAVFRRPCSWRNRAGSDEGRERGKERDPDDKSGIDECSQSLSATSLARCVREARESTGLAPCALLLPEVLPLATRVRVLRDLRARGAFSH